VEGSSATPPSHIRVSFEVDPTKRHIYSSLQLQFQNLNHDDDASSTYSGEYTHTTCSGLESRSYQMKAQTRIPQRSNAKPLKSFSIEQTGIGRLDIKSQTSTPRTVTLKEIRDQNLLKRSGGTAAREFPEGQMPLIGEIGEPFWIQQTTEQSWEEPDVICRQEIEKLISSDDKKFLWEMISLLIDYPNYHRCCEGFGLDSSNTSSFTSFMNETIPSLMNLSNPSELASIFHRKEYEVLWSIEAPDYLPLATAQDLLRFAFCSHSTPR
jgi:hypothetical protein